MPLPDHLRVMMSSEKGDWGTPDPLYNPVHNIFHFNLDVCATRENTKVPDSYITPEMNAFVTPWALRKSPKSQELVPAMCWNNPPYGKPENPCVQPWEKCTKKVCKRRGFHIQEYIPGIGDWVERALKQTDDWGSTVVNLLPARTDTDWFQVVWSNAQLIAFLRGRFKFVGADESAPFPSVIAAFAREPFEDDVYEAMTELGNVIDPRDGKILVYQGGE